jgi:hypothetical protein
MQGYIETALLTVVVAVIVALDKRFSPIGPMQRREIASPSFELERFHQTLDVSAARSGQ